MSGIAYMSGLRRFGFQLSCDFGCILGGKLKYVWNPLGCCQLHQNYVRPLLFLKLNMLNLLSCNRFHLALCSQCHPQDLDRRSKTR